MMHAVELATPVGVPSLSEPGALVIPKNADIGRRVVYRAFPGAEPLTGTLSKLGIVVTRCFVSFPVASGRGPDIRHLSLLELEWAEA